MLRQEVWQCQRHPAQQQQGQGPETYWPRGRGPLLLLLVLPGGHACGLLSLQGLALPLL